MSIQPKVSIVLINYNGYRDTIECLQSLRNITYSNYEVIIVDNASTNESVTEIKRSITSNSNEVLIESKINGGFSAGNNLGIEYALQHGADYCLLLNNDTVVDTQFLSELIEAMQKHPSGGLAIGKILYESNRELIWYAGGELNYKTARTTHCFYKKIDKGLSDDVQKVTFATGCCMCLSRAAIEKVGLMNEEYFMYVEDVEYCIKLQARGFDMIYVPSARIYHKVGASTKTASTFSQFYTIRNKLFLIQKNFKGMNKITAYLYTYLQYFYRCVKREYVFKVYLSAIKAFKRNESGKNALI